MASTSSSSVQKSFKYDVFLSFRGEDTRKTFVDHLYLALVNRGIITYKDDETIEKGGRVSDQLLQSIEDSRFYIIVFSKNYASSSWCLNELVKIMECQKTIEQTAYPVFYDVEPTEVRNQSGAVGEAFAKHVRDSWSSVLLLDRFLSIVASCCNGSSSSLNGLKIDLENEDDVGRWRNALKEAAALAGMELKKNFNGHKAKFIQKIVEEISQKLHYINSSFDGKLAGMETRVKDVVSSLEIGFEDVRMVGIKGMGGGGKTTLARAVFDHISISFEGKSFVDNVREGSKGFGLKELQKQVLKDVQNNQNIDVTSVYDGKDKMKKMMGSKKVPVVLDDVDDIDQLEALAGGHNWFKPGSRIIITTRDKQVLVAHRVNFIHDVNLLSNEEAICLFSKYAFGRKIPNQGYKELSGKVTHYAAGLPLTLKVLGSHLCGRTEYEWVDAIERLKTIPLEKTLKRLELSYNGLEDDQKEIFLDVVCKLKGEPKDTAIRILGSCGFNAKIGLSVLEQKSLITISDIHGLRFHDHIEEMGWNIVCRLHPHRPNRHSRLWIQEEIENILVNDLGTTETKCIKLNYTHPDSATIIKGLRNMRELRCLHVEVVSKVGGGICEYLQDALPDALRTLYWPVYPFCCLPKTFQANNLVYLQMPLSFISQLWEAGERKVLDKLKFIDLSYSKMSTLNIGMTPHLEHIELKGCSEFVEIQMPIKCPNLRILNLCGSKLRSLNLEMTPHLEQLDLKGCNEFVELHLPVECLNLRILNLSGSKLRNLNLGMTPHLMELYLEGCNEFLVLHLPVECPNLKYLNLRGSKVTNLNLEMTPHLMKLDLQGCYFLKEVLAPVGCLQKLVYLELSRCLRFEHFLVEKQNRSTIATLKLIAKPLNICPVHPSSNLPKFQFECYYHEPLYSMSGNTEKLLSFGLCACTNLESFSASIYSLQHLRKLSLQGWIPDVSKDIWQLESLEKLTLRMKEIKHLPDSICMLKHLKSLHLKSCCLLEELPKDLDRLECLEVLNLEDCISLRDIPSSICNVKWLTRLHLPYCILVEKLPEELGRLECLKCLNLEGAGISSLPQSIFQLKGLCIIGSKWQLESYGFTSLEEVSSLWRRSTASYFVYLRGVKTPVRPSLIISIMLFTIEALLPTKMMKESRKGKRSVISSSNP